MKFLRLGIFDLDSQIAELHKKNRQKRVMRKFHNSKKNQIRSMVKLGESYKSASKNIKAFTNLLHHVEDRLTVESALNLHRKSI